MSSALLRAVPLSPSIGSRLTAEEQQLRKALLQRLVAMQGAVDATEAGGMLGWPPEQTAAVMASLGAKKLIVLDEQGRVTCAYPVSSAPTGHRVTLDDGRTLYAMCAIDALGCCFEFDQPVRIDAACHVCAAPLHIIVNSATEVASLPQDVYATHVDLNKYDDWAANT